MQPISSDNTPLTDYPEDLPSRDPPMTYRSVVYYWYDRAEPAELDQDGNGRPGEGQFPQSDLAAVFEDTIPLPTQASDVAPLAQPLTTYQIRRSLADELIDDQAYQGGLNPKREVLPVP